MPSVRITGGTLRGTQISVLSNVPARYTSSKVREAIFNIIGSVEGMTVLDLFAGSGSFSIEALSRGASSATLVESNRKMTALIEKNLARVALNKYCQVFHMDVRYAIPFLYGRKKAYDIIFMDPPYEKGYFTETMTILDTHPLYAAGTIMIAEYSKRDFDAMACFKGRAEEKKTREYGDTVITVLTDARHSRS